MNTQAPPTCTSCNLEDVIDRQLTGQDHDDCENTPTEQQPTKAEAFVDALLGTLPNRPNFL